MSQPAGSAAVPAASAALEQGIGLLARGGSIEINVQDAGNVAAARAFLPPGSRIYVSFLSRQSWPETQAAARAVRAAGFEPVPHVPVRRMSDPGMLERNLEALVAGAQVRELLLISGDYAQAQGPYSSVLQVMQSGLLAKHGIRRLSVAGHPEGHPAVPLEVIRRAERDKAALAAEQGIELTLLTQVVFEHEPFLQWATALRAQGVRARIVAGLAGPVSVATLLRFAVRCGAGPSIRALGVRPGMLAKLLGDRGPEDVVCGLAAAQARGAAPFEGIHLFCFGGFLRAAEWLHKVAGGRFRLDGTGSFRV